MTIKYYVHPISHDLLIYNFETKVVLVIQEVDNVQVMLAGQVVENTEYLGSRNFLNKTSLSKKRSPDFMSQSDRVKELLLENPNIKPQEITDDTGIPINTVYSIKSRLKKDGELDTKTL